MIEFLKVIDWHHLVFIIILILFVPLFWGKENHFSNLMKVIINKIPKITRAGKDGVWFSGDTEPLQDSTVTEKLEEKLDSSKSASSLADLLPSIKTRAEEIKKSLEKKDLMSSENTTDGLLQIIAEDEINDFFEKNFQIASGGQLALLSQLYLKNDNAIEQSTCIQTLLFRIEYDKSIESKLDDQQTYSYFNCTAITGLLRLESAGFVKREENNKHPNKPLIILTQIGKDFNVWMSKKSYKRVKEAHSFSNYPVG